jgi:hypothetical protein
MKKIVILCIVTILTTSCMSLAVKFMKLDNKDAKVVTFTNNDKTVVFVPMKHIGPQEFYDDVKHIIDSLHAEGYIAYLESTRITDSLTEEENKIVHLKVRKMLGTYLSSAGYLDTVNKKLMGRRFSNKMKLVNQPPYKKIGADSLTDKVVDVPMNKIVTAYEKKYGTLQLNDCDYVLAPEAKYECGKEPRRQVDAIIMGYREQHLANTITKDRRKKIAVIYGAFHERGLLRELQKTDSTWTYKK